MSLYVRLDAEYASDVEFIEAGPMAELLYIRALCFCKRKLIDGTVSSRQLPAAPDAARSTTTGAPTADAPTSPREPKEHSRHEHDARPGPNCPHDREPWPAHAPRLSDPAARTTADGDLWLRLPHQQPTRAPLCRVPRSRLPALPDLRRSPQRGGTMSRLARPERDRPQVIAWPVEGS